MATPQFYTYDPGRVTATFKGKEIVGFHDGTFISAERDEDGWSKHKGATGDGTRVRNRNKGGAVTFTLHQSSPSNDDLRSIAAADEEFGTGVGELLVKDLNGNTVIQAENAWIKKFPTVDLADDVGPREWVIDCDDLDLAVGGATVA